MSVLYLLALANSNAAEHANFKIGFSVKAFGGEKFELYIELSDIECMKHISYNPVSKQNSMICMKTIWSFGIFIGILCMPASFLTTQLEA